MTSALQICCNDVSIEARGDVFLKCYYTSLCNTVGCYWLNQAAKLGSEFLTTFQLFAWQFAFLCMLPVFWWRPLCCRVVFTFRSNWVTCVSGSVKRWLLEGVCECKHQRTAPVNAICDVINIIMLLIGGIGDKISSQW